MNAGITMKRQTITNWTIRLLIFITLLACIACNEKPTDSDENKGFKTKPLPQESFKDVALQYKDAMDQGQRGNLVSLVEKNSRNIIYHTINLEHMIYFAAVNGVGTNRLILMLRNENANLQFRSSEIKWINDRWQFESDALLNEKFTRPKIPTIQELIDVKVTVKKNDDLDYTVYFGDVTISAEKYNINLAYIPFYWEYDEATKTIYVPEVCLHMIQTAGFARVDLIKSYVMRGKKPIKILDHPLFLWKGEVPHWAEQTMRNEKYFYDASLLRRPKTSDKE